MENNGLSDFEQAVSGICLFVIWLVGIVICIENNKIVIEWFIISGIISVCFFLSMLSYLKKNTNDIRARLENNQQIDIENPSNKIKQTITPVKIYCKNLPEDYADVCLLCLEKLDDNVCTISDCNKHFYHVKCIESYVNNGYTQCSVCKK